MKNRTLLLKTAIIISLVIHGLLFFSFLQMSKNDTGDHRIYDSSTLVQVTISEKKQDKPQPKKKKDLPKKSVKKKKKPPVKLTKKKLDKKIPLSHKRSEKKTVTKTEDIKPVFGVTKQTVEKSKANDNAISVRVGNTLMKEQEKEYTPPEKVRDYITVPVFDLTTLPAFQKKIKPEFPEELKEKGLEGDVYLSASIDDLGIVQDVSVTKSDHELFSRAAVKALLSSRFVPATQDGMPVGTILEGLIYSFLLDD